MGDFFVEKDDLEKIIDKYYDMVFRIALLQIKNRSDAEDVTQEVFISLVKYNRKFKDEEHLKSWLIRVTINNSHNLRSNVWNKKTVEIEDIGLKEEDFSQMSEMQITVYSAVSSLKEEYRTVVHLYYYEGYSVAEISKILKISEGTVKMRLKRSRDKLAEILREEENND